MNDPVFLPREAVLELHRTSLELHDGLDGMREPGLLDSALMQPEATNFYGEGDLAAAYAFHIAQNQPFLDGNKRTSLVVAELFLVLNGLELTSNDTETVATFLQLAAGELTEEALADWIEANATAVR